MDYFDYLQSDAWREVKRRYLRSARPKDCRICGASRFDARLDLHHRTYERLGRERLSDLVLLCRRCHDAVHALAKARRMPIWKASDPRRVRAFMRRS
jgi:5-methylcytosine-specific restriction endonuclease McrA